MEPIDKLDPMHKRRSWVLSLLGSVGSGRVLMTLATIATVSTVGVFATQATLTDQVTMAQISVTSGTLDLRANTGNGPNQAWVGSVSAAITGALPGQEFSGTVNLKNNGNVPFTTSVTTSGVDASGCFSYFFRETSVVTGATAASSWPQTLAGMGTAAGADGTTAALTGNVTNLALPDNGADLIWETDDEKQYTVTVRVKSSCATNAANGTIDFTFNATQ